MERHKSFKKLKKRTNSSSTNNFISGTTENSVISFIDLLRVSIIPASITTDKATVIYTQTNSEIHAR